MDRANDVDGFAEAEWPASGSNPGDRVLPREEPAGASPPPAATTRNPFRSLRWRLQAWHALILLVVVAGFAVPLYFQLRRATLDEIDAELLAGARVLEGSLRGVVRPEPGLAPGRGPRPLAGPEDDVPRRPPPLPGRGWPPPEERGFAPPPRPGPADRPPREALRAMLRLPGSLVARHEKDEQPVYYEVRLPGGELLIAEPAPTGASFDDDLRPGRESRIRQRGKLREVIMLGPGRTRILVGRPIGRELAALRRQAVWLGLTGLAVFAGGLVGGWWLSARAVRPIRAMSQTVAGITARRLAQRVDLTDVDAELAELGAILNRMLGRLESSFEQQVRFTADASHELRTPLSVILSHIELALARPRSPEEYREALTTCGRAASRMKALVDDLLTLARADAGRLELKAVPIDLADVARECVLLLETLAERRGVKIEVETQPAALVADPDRLGQVATNLIANAILYNRAGGRVVVSTSATDDEAILTVADTGAGIAEDDIPRLFDRFYRVDPARSREHGGSGLGLAICRSIVLAHHGRIAVDSHPGAGTTVRVFLPSGASEQSPRQSPQPG